MSENYNLWQYYFPKNTFLEFLDFELYKVFIILNKITTLYLFGRSTEKINLYKTCIYRPVLADL